MRKKAKTKAEKLILLARKKAEYAVTTGAKEYFIENNGGFFVVEGEPGGHFNKTVKNSLVYARLNQDNVISTEIMHKDLLASRVIFKKENANYIAQFEDIQVSGENEEIALEMLLNNLASIAI